MRVKLFLAALVSYFLFLFAGAPATLFDAVLRRSSDGKLRLAEAQGTIWSGGGRLELRGADAKQGAGKPVSWRLLPGALLGGRLSYTLEMGRTPFVVSLAPSGLEIGEVDITLPASILGVAFAKLAPLEPTGDLQLRVDQFALSRPGLRVSAVLRWLNAGSAHSPVSPLGDYELKFDSAGNPPRIALHTLRGILTITGKGNWSSTDIFSFRASLSVPPAQRRQLAPLLGLIALEREEGIFELTVN